jgi:hypothetical protein
VRVNQYRPRRDSELYREGSAMFSSLDPDRVASVDKTSGNWRGGRMLRVQGRGCQVLCANGLDIRRATVPRKQAALRAGHLR